MMWTPEHEQAYQEWIKNLGPPSMAHEIIKNRMKRLKMTPQEIKDDMNAKRSSWIS